MAILRSTEEVPYLRWLALASTALQQHMLLNIESQMLIDILLTNLVAVAAQNPLFLLPSKSKGPQPGSR